MGMGMGGMLAGGLLASVAGSFIGTAIAQEMFDHDDYMASGFAEGGEGSDINFDNDQVDATGVDSTGGDAGSDYGSGDAGGDPGGDSGGGDAFGDFGDGGGSDFGDFGGGDFGGGDW